MVWSDEFNNNGQPNEIYWNFETGFVRNEEFQWNQSSNAYCNNGVLIIEGKKEIIDNPDYHSESRDWRESRKQAQYTLACIKTNGKKEFLYGRFEIRAKIPVATGVWPAIWTLGKDMAWPSCREIDIMEYYQIEGKPHILANVAWGTNRRFHAM